MFDQSHRYNVHGQWTPAPVRTATGSAPSGLNSPHLAAALAQIERAFGGSKVAGGKA